jgi:Beta-propeller repeat/Putative Ig domain
VRKAHLGMFSKQPEQSGANKTGPSRRLAVALLFVAIAGISNEVVTRISKPALSKSGSVAISNLPARSVETSVTDRTAHGNPSLYEAFGEQPLQFEVNEGRTDPRVKFVSHGPGYGLFLTNNEAVLQLRNADFGLRNRKPAVSPTSENPPSAISNPQPADPQSEVRNPQSRSALLRLQVVGGNRHSKMTALDRSPATTNYLIGNDRRQWRTNVQAFQKVQYENIYPGVDMIYYGNQRQLEYDFRVAPGADPHQIKLAFKGARHLRIDKQGDLILKTDAGDVRLHRPHIYQEINRDRREIHGRFVLRRKAHAKIPPRKSRLRTPNPVLVSFEVGDYDQTRPLVIDPTLLYSATFGGNFNDDVNGIAVDSSGNAYVVGTTFSLNFPVVSGFQSTLSGGLDAFVSKLGPTGTLVYSTYLGGTGDDQGRAIAVDSSGSVYVIGSTRSTNFPTASPLQAANAGGFTDVFVAKMNPAGSALVYSTYIGGADQESGGGIAVDSGGNAYVTGFTQSSNFPTKSGSFQTTFGGGTCFVNRPCADAFIFKLNAAGSAFAYSTFLGGNGNDNLDFAAAQYGAIAVDGSGNAYVTGVTSSTNFPAAGPLQSACNACNSVATDAFVTKLNVVGSALVYSTYLGGTGIEVGRAIAVDSAGNAYVTGNTGSNDFPTTTGAFQRTQKGGYDGFAVKLSVNGSSLTYSSYLGGAGDDVPNGIAVDSSGNVYLTGTTSSPDFPLVNAMQAKGGGGLFKTTNGGTSWSVINAGLPFVTSAIVIDPTNSNVVYVGNGFGVAKSLDGGTTWSATAFNNSAVSSLVLDPNNPSIVYAGAFNAFGKSTNAGNTWTTITSGLSSIGGTEAVAIDPTNTSNLYIATSNAGVLKSTDGGLTWSAINNGITDLFVDIVVLDKTTPATLYAGNSQGVLKTTNGGATWTVNSTGLPAGSGRFVDALAFDPTTTSTIYATTADVSVQGGVFKSTNSGGNWTALVRTDFTVGSIVIDRSNANTIYVASNASTNTGLPSPSSGVGILKSTDGGATWTGSGLTQDFIQGLTIDPNNSLTIYAPASGGNDAFVAKLDASGSTLGFASYFGGTGAEQGNAIAVDPSGKVYIAGATASADFPKQTASPQTAAGTEAEAPSSNTNQPASFAGTIAAQQADDSFIGAIQVLGVCTLHFAAGNFQPATVGTPYEGSISLTGAQGSVTWGTSGTLPDGLTFQNGAISGTPTKPGTYNFAITAQDSTGPVCAISQAITITVSCSLHFASGNFQSATIGTPYGGSISLTGVEGQVTWSTSGTLPDGLTFKDGSVSGTPTKAGTYNFTITAQDSSGCAISQPIAITVNPATFPVAYVTNTNNGGTGSLSQALIGAAGSPGTHVLFTISGNPPFAVSPTGSLPVPDQTTIDGNSELDQQGNPLVILNGCDLQVA